MQRRDFLKTAASTALALGLTSNKALAHSCDIDTDPDFESAARAHLRSIMPTRKEVDIFLAGKNNGRIYDPHLGWVFCDHTSSDAVDNSVAYYHYEPDGARKNVNFPDKPSRIHAYGNSFTHCDQVSDAETWTEYLAGHIQEPIRNYGIGGYSVYQAYLRMLKIESKTPAEYIILNIWSDDHFRNLDAWRSIRFGRRTADGFTLPHLKVDVSSDTCRNVDNLITKPADVYSLCDEDFVWQNFKDDDILRLVLAARKDDNTSPKALAPVAVSFGIPDETIADTAVAERIKKIHTEAALYATKKIITWTEDFVNKNGSKLMLILSHRYDHIVDALQNKQPFDKSFLHWLKDKPYPVIDMRQKFIDEYKRVNIDIHTFLQRYYIGHHTPYGNFFTAWALKNHIKDLLNPAPLPYR